MARQPEPERSLRRELEKIWEAIKVLRNSASLEGTGLSTVDEDQTILPGSIQIPNNGSFINWGGDIISLSDLAIEILRIGNMPMGDTGLRVKRQDDSTAIEMRVVFGDATSPQSLLLLTRTGRIFSGDSVLANGISAPYMHHPFFPVDPTGPFAVGVTSGTFVATHECYVNFQNPAIAPKFKVKCSDGTTAGEIQIWDALNSVYLGGYFGSPATRTATIPTGTTTWTVFEFDSTGPGDTLTAMLAGDFGDAVQLEIHVRRTAGAGTITVSPLQTLGSDA